MSHFIYKICPAPLWQSAEADGVFKGAGIDLQDGYIHFSTYEQSAETLALHFTKQTGLTFVQVDTRQLDIKWEASRGGQLFPHLYDALPMSAVTATWQLELDDDGMHILPAISNNGS